MDRYDFDAGSANEATGFSGFGGHRLAQSQGVRAFAAEAGEAGDGNLGTLASLGIEDAEQLVAVAAVPGVRQELESVLGTRKRGIQSLVSLLSRAEEVLPAERLALVSTPAPRDVGLGVLPPSEEMIVAAEASSMTIAAEARAVALPPSVNLIPYMSPIRNQRARGTCVSFTLTALNEYILRRRGKVRDLSEQHLYNEIKLIDGAPDLCGTWQVKAVTALQERGQCREVVWPYNPNSACNDHGPRPAQARPNALNYRLRTVQVPARSVVAYKTHMANRRPVTLSIPVYNSWHQSAETRRSGRITMRIGQEVSETGHAVLLVGYQDSPDSPGGGYFIVRNSWGTTTWGYQSPYGAGYGTIPYQYITNDAWEAFTAFVQGVAGDEEEFQDGEDEQLETGSSTITIEVSPNVKITIARQ